MLKEKKPGEGKYFFAEEKEKEEKILEKEKIFWRKNGKRKEGKLDHVYGA